MSSRLGYFFHTAIWDCFPPATFIAFGLSLRKIKFHKLLYDDFSYWLDCCCFFFFWCSAGGHKCVIRCVTQTLHAFPKSPWWQSRCLQWQVTGRNLHMNSHYFSGQTKLFSGFSGSVTGTACNFPYLNLSWTCLESHVHTIYMAVDNYNKLTIIQVAHNWSGPTARRTPYAE